MKSLAILQSEKVYQIQGVTLQQAQVMNILAAYKQCDVNGIARSIGAARSSTSELLKRMERAGLVCRYKPLKDDDQRYVLIELSAKGRRLVKERDALVRRTHPEVVARLHAKP